ncbi:hypothetical protein [Longispora albida]|uniref:hypothetical protein n=1 Tax=Longispora albida TaxID=203523 RepID=UPI000380B7F9|nr:hypothetical protein [Longispora albida]
MTTPVSVRFEDHLLTRLRRRAAGTPGASVSGLVQRLVDEGLRLVEHPGVVFKDGPSGRRAALAAGPDIWEIVTVLREVDERGPAAIAATADILSLPVPQIKIAIRYYADFTAEIDAEIAEADAESEAAQAAWEAEQRLLA